MEQLERNVAGDRTRLCVRQIQEEHLELQTMRSRGIEFDDAKSAARIIMAHGEAAAAIRKAIKASGVVVHVELAEFSNIVSSPRVSKDNLSTRRAGLKLRQERDVYSVQSPPSNPEAPQGAI